MFPDLTSFHSVWHQFSDTSLTGSARDERLADLFRDGRSHKVGRLRKKCYSAYRIKRRIAAPNRYFTSVGSQVLDDICSTLSAN